MTYLISLYDLKLKDGSLPDPGSNKMVIPETLAENRDLRVGDVIGNPDQPAFPGAPSLLLEFVISGIFAQPESPQIGDGRGFISLEFLETQEPIPIPDEPPLIVVPRSGQKGVLDSWLENDLVKAETSILTNRQEVTRVREKVGQDMLSMALLEGTLALVAALGLAILNHIFISQRQLELGVLRALGFSRSQLERGVFA